METSLSSASQSHEERGLAWKSLRPSVPCWRCASSAIEQGSQIAVSDASRAIQDMILAAWAEGVGSNWAGFHHLEPVKPLLGIPDEFDVLAIVPLGYPTQTLGKGAKKRKALGEVAHREQWGHPFA